MHVLSIMLWLVLFIYLENVSALWSLNNAIDFFNFVFCNIWLDYNERISKAFFLQIWLHFLQRVSITIFCAYHLIVYMLKHYTFKVYMLKYQINCFQNNGLHGNQRAHQPISYLAFHMLEWCPGGVISGLLHSILQLNQRDDWSYKHT